MSTEEQIELFFDAVEESSQNLLQAIWSDLSHKPYDTLQIDGTFVLDYALIIAAAAAPVHIIEWLLKKGADPNASDGDAIVMALNETNEPAVDAMFKAGIGMAAKRNALLAAAANGHTKTTDSLLDEIPCSALSYPALSQQIQALVQQRELQKRLEMPEDRAPTKKHRAGL